MLRPFSFLSSLPLKDRIVFPLACLGTAITCLFLLGDAFYSAIPLLSGFVVLALALFSLFEGLVESSGEAKSAPTHKIRMALYGISLAGIFLSLDVNLELQLSIILVSLGLVLLARSFGFSASLLFALPILFSHLTMVIAHFSAPLFPSVGLLAAWAIAMWPAQRSLYMSAESISSTPLFGEDELSDRQHGLEQRLAEQAQAFDQEMNEQTKHLRDANTQLSQQIALRKTISDALVKSQTRLTQAIDASHLGLIDWDISAGQFYQSAFHEQFGDKEQRSEQVIETLKKVIHSDDYQHVRDVLNACLRGDQLAYDLQYRVKDGNQWCWIEECGKVVDTGSDGRALRMLGTRRNIQSEVLRDEQVRLAKSVFDHTSEGVYVLDQNGQFLSANPAYARILGGKSDELVGRSIDAITETPHRTELYNEILKEVRESGSWQGELLEKRLQGDYFPQWTQINAIEDEAGHLKYFAGVATDISARKEADQKLDYLLNYDDLTKLANRVQFLDHLHRALLRFKDQHVPFVLVSLDIDRFKQFNDSFGHESADRLLVDIAERLSNSVQKVDILARVGGNEFACIVECSATFDVMKFAQRLFKSVTQGHYEVEDHSVILSCSVGVARVPEDTQDIATLMRYSALAVQKAKYHGGNQIQLFDESLKSFSRRRLEMEHELRKALNNHELEVYYQPKLDLNKDRITSYEALIRWIHPTLGVISPEEFVNIAEENGLISDLGNFVLETACQQTQEWMAQGLGILHVSVNLSARQLKEKGFQQLVSKVLGQSHIAPECLELELTESMIMEDADSAVLLLNNLRETGIKISIDDFGTGYSSLSYLRDLPVDTLKIDRSFVDQMEVSQQQLAIVKSIVVLGESLGLQIVAEGVENEKQLGLLKQFGCDLVQGYLVSKPLSAKEMEKLLLAQHEAV